MPEKLEVSVIIPAYGTAKNSARRWTLFFAQAIRDVEVMVINDDSPDSDELEQGITPFRERIDYAIHRPYHPRQRRSRGAKQVLVQCL